VVQPNVITPDQKAGVQVGELVRVTRDGFERLHSAPRGFLRSQANTIEGGTSAIMRNILGERVLGLPKDPDQSRDVPWKDVPRSV